MNLKIKKTKKLTAFKAKANPIFSIVVQSVYLYHLWGRYYEDTHRDVLHRKIPFISALVVLSPGLEI